MKSQPKLDSSTSNSGATINKNNNKKKKTSSNNNNNNNTSNNNTNNNNTNNISLSNKSGGAANLSRETIAEYFKLPLHEACVALKVDEPSLKKRCRELEILRWPYRKRCNLLKEINGKSGNTDSNSTNSDGNGVQGTKLISQSNHGLFSCFQLNKPGKNKKGNQNSSNQQQSQDHNSESSDKETTSTNHSLSNNKMNSQPVNDRNNKNSNDSELVQQVLLRIEEKKKEGCSTDEILILQNFLQKLEKIDKKNGAEPAEMNVKNEPRGISSMHTGNNYSYAPPHSFVPPPTLSQEQSYYHQQQQKELYAAEVSRYHQDMERRRIELANMENKSDYMNSGSPNSSYMNYHYYHPGKKVSQGYKYNYANSPPPSTLPQPTLPPVSLEHEYNRRYRLPYNELPPSPSPDSSYYNPQHQEISRHHHQMKHSNEHLRNHHYQPYPNASTPLSSYRMNDSEPLLSYPSTRQHTRTLPSYSHTASDNYLVRPSNETMSFSSDELPIANLSLNKSKGESPNNRPGALPSTSSFLYPNATNDVSNNNERNNQPHYYNKPIHNQLNKPWSNIGSGNSGSNDKNFMFSDSRITKQPSQESRLPLPPRPPSSFNKSLKFASNNKFIKEKNDYSMDTKNEYGSSLLSGYCENNNTELYKKPVYYERFSEKSISPVRTESLKRMRDPTSQQTTQSTSQFGKFQKSNAINPLQNQNQFRTQNINQNNQILY